MVQATDEDQGTSVGLDSSALDDIGVRQAVAAARRGIFLVELMLGEKARARRATRCRELLEKAKSAPRRIRSWSWDETDSSEDLRPQLERIVNMVPAASLGNVELGKQWSVIQSSAASASAQDLEAQLTSFVYASTRRVVRWVEDALSLIWRNLAVLSGIAICIVLTCCVEQIYALLLERWWYPLAVLAALLPAPALAFIAHWVGRSERYVPRSISSLARVGFFWRPAARYPVGYDVLAANRAMAARLTRATLLKFAIFSCWQLVAFEVFTYLGTWFGILRTLGQVTTLVNFALGVLAVLDLWDFVHPAPVRRLFLGLIGTLWLIYAWYDPSFQLNVLSVGAVIVLLVFTLLERPQFSRSPFVVAGIVLVVALTAIWREEAIDRDEAWKSPSGTAIASNEAALIKFDEWPHAGPREASESPVVVMTASGGGSRAALLAILALQQLENTCPLSIPIDGASNEPPGNQAAGGGDSARLDQAAAEVRKGCLQAEQASRTCDAQSLANHLQAISSVSGGSLASATYLAARFSGQPLQAMDDKMADDFLQPVLDGARTFGTSRGRELEEYWKKKLDLKRTMRELAHRWRAGLREDRIALPIPIFNSATLDSHAVVVTPLDWTDAYSEESEREALGGKSLYGDEKNPTWVYYRWGVYALQQLVPGFDPSLAQAVRASANFPFGFPVVQIEAKNSLHFSPIQNDRGIDPKERVRLTDGGVLSNSGMWTLFRFLIAHADTLRRRGLLLLMVDATRMPEYVGRTRTRDLVHSIFDETPVAGNLHATMIAYLRKMLDGKFAAIELSMPPKRDSNFYTSWALDERTRERLAEDARERLQKMQAELRTGFCELSHPRGKPVSRLDRVPLD